MERDFSATYHKRLNKIKIEKQKKLAAKERKSNSRWATQGVTLDDVFQLMAIKAKFGHFQSLNPRDFGADYDMVPIPREDTKEASFWFNENNTIEDEYTQI